LCDIQQLLKKTLGIWASQDFFDAPLFDWPPNAWSSGSATECNSNNNNDLRFFQLTPLSTVQNVQFFRHSHFTARNADHLRNRL